MDFDLLSVFLGDPVTGTSPQLLSNLQDRERLTHEQHSEDSALEREYIDYKPSDPNQVGAVITKIEDIFESIADCILEEGKELVIPLKTRPRKKNIANDDGSTQVNKGSSVEARSITFPSKSPQEAWKFSKRMACDIGPWLTRIQLHFSGYWSSLMKHLSQELLQLKGIR
jgi:meiotic recombination protein SPO11